MALLAMTLGATTARAADARLTIANDPVASNSRPDDLYTADLQLAVAFERVRLVAGERMFTDKLEAYRFDETYLAISPPSRQMKRWDVTLAAGVLHTGRGLLGEPSQNAVHRAIGNEEVHLPYVRKSHLYPTLEIAAERPARRIGRVELTSRGGAYTAPGFRSWMRAEVVADQPLGAGFSLHYGVGARADLPQSEWIDEHIDSLGPTAQIGISYRSVDVRWAYNDYGTRTSHLSVGFRPQRLLMR